MKVICLGIADDHQSTDDVHKRYMLNQLPYH